MQRLSALLKNRREYLNYPLEKISEITKIRIDYLIALEEQNYDIFPSEVYLKGILQIYSKFLGLDNNLVQALYRREQTVTDKSKKIQPLSKEFGQPRFVITSNKLIVFGIAIAIIAVVIFVMTQVARLTKTPDLFLIEPVVASGNNQEVIYKTDKEEINIAGSTESGANVYINNQKVSLNPLNEFRIDGYKINMDTNILLIKAENQFGKATEIKLSVYREKPKEVIPEVVTTSSQAAVTYMSLALDVKEDSNIKLSLDGVNKINRLVNAGTLINQSTRVDLGMTANKTIEINSSNIDSVKVTINGIEYKLKSGTNIFQLENGVIIVK